MVSSMLISLYHGLDGPLPGDAASQIVVAACNCRPGLFDAAAFVFTIIKSATGCLGFRLTQ